MVVVTRSWLRSVTQPLCRPRIGHLYDRDRHRIVLLQRTSCHLCTWLSQPVSGRAMARNRRAPETLKWQSNNETWRRTPCGPYICTSLHPLRQWFASTELTLITPQRIPVLSGLTPTSILCSARYDADPLCGLQDTERCEGAGEDVYSSVIGGNMLVAG